MTRFYQVCLVMVMVSLCAVSAWAVPGSPAGASAAPVGPSTGAAASAPAAASQAQVQAVTVRDVQSGFTFRDNLGRTFKLIAVKKFDIDSRAQQIAYDSNMKAILRNWLNTPGETVFVMHDGRRARDGAIPALVYVGANFNVGLQYAWRQLAQVDTDVPAWFDLDLFLQDANNVPADIAQELGIETNTPSVGNALSIFVYKGEELLYSGYVYPSGQE